ncbi:MAG: xanthine dehydrogenase accessory [Geobacteraceae bacterium]|nr:MAG: xanthine dehydrogenase accessory [Geobacteraceae bacterium]
MTDLDIYQEIIRLNQAGAPSALATVVESAGSSPRKAGAKMLVRGDGSILGTIGGGKPELETIAASLAALEEGKPRTVTFTLTEEYGHVCGGSLLVYIEPSAVRPHLLIIGAGHVGRALATAARFAGFRVTVADERPEYANSDQVPDADETLAGECERVFERVAIDSAAAIVITTTGFEKDFAAARCALKTSARYIGVIGSRRKRDILVNTLTEEGFSLDDIGRITIPVGLAIGAETPAEIAVAIVAQLIQARKGNAVPYISDLISVQLPFTE